MATKKVYGQAWIQNNKSLVQDIITFNDNGIQTDSTEVIIEDIWEDLKDNTSSHKYKFNGKKYFFWEYTMTSDEGEDIKIKFEAPRPKPGLFPEPYDPEDYSEPYAKYWVGKLKESTENYEDKIAIQKKEVIFPTHTVTNFETGEPEIVDEIIVKNTDLSDISSLLSLF